ncbi:response regulator transcription factor [Nocardia jejuensis]|uniref:response regulator transcription factor n=1 Tax=Nocardia jejuensis TaxID=328049 RepID=UPI001C3FACCB|nr:LuxR C-terminal-related transcriptional regulator [Nocardia jejuensis]
MDDAVRQPSVAAIDHDHQVVAEYWKDEIGRVKNLSERELDVFLMLGTGKSNRTMAQQFNIAERTVKAHVTQILSKLDVESRLQAGLVSYAFQLLPENATPHPEPNPLVQSKSA